MRSARAWLAGVFDVRSGEWRVALLAFSALLLILTGHTILETARDALLLTRLPARGIGVVYVAVAAVTLPSAAIAGRAGARLGTRRALIGALLLAALMMTALFLVHTSQTTVMALYVGSSLIGSIVVPQFWTLLGAALTVSQGRRLFGPIGAAAVIGGVLGSGLAALALPTFRVKALLPLSAGVFVVAAAVLVFLRTPKRRAAPAAPAAPAFKGVLAGLREEPFLAQVALVVALSTATLLAMDYFFKWTVVRALPAAEVGVFVARYYALLNGVSLIVQLFFSSAIVRRLGIGAALVVSPLLLFVGAIGAFAVGGAFVVVLLMKATEDSFRNSLHRSTVELLYLPVRSELRQRMKPVIDGALGRMAQAAAAGIVLWLSSAAVLSPRAFAALVGVAAAAWLASAVWTRRSYLGLLRRAVGSIHSTEGPDPLDWAGAEVLLEHLASDEPFEVIAAMAALERRGRQRLIPALVLHHEDERVLLRALEIFGASSRTDWISLARRLLEHPREPVRIAAARALAARGELDLDRLAGDAGPRVRGYAALHRAVRAPEGPLREDPRIAGLLKQPGPEGKAARLGILAGIADNPASERLADLLVALADETSGEEPAEEVELLARASARLGDRRMISPLMSRLTKHTALREVQAALAELGEPAMDALWSALRDARRERHLRVHLPFALAHFGTKRAADLLLENIESEKDGLVRYKSIRALGRLVADHDVRVERVRVERLARANLLEHFRILGLSVALEGQPEGGAADASRYTTGRLLVGLLDDKLRQSVERAFRLLKIAHPVEDIHRVHVATLSRDQRARANAAEFLDALLTRGDQQALRQLFRLLVDDLSPAERAARAASFLPRSPPVEREGALRVLVEEQDLVVSALATLYALAVGGRSLSDAVERARRQRPEIERTAARLLRDPVRAGEAAHG
ncbi:MAG TPA: hypothetical protein VIF15_19030 [Polyangiaceae bacterium]